ncbi:MAG: hypothetical protein JRI55_24885, partial [Deltaproteobacteria bacterium]|nr:hypothetical protein [Deltaproteobacteria bacterium]
PGEKYYEWERKGVPIRIELGPRDIKDETKVTIRCVPLAGQGPDPEPGACVRTGKPSRQRVLFAKAY